MLLQYFVNTELNKFGTKYITTYSMAESRKMVVVVVVVDLEIGLQRLLDST